jgi:preprotein translocase SecE subunit
MIKASIKYFKDVYGELSRVTWPSFSEFMGATIVVLVVVFLSIAYIGILDVIFAKLARYVLLQYVG